MSRSEIACAERRRAARLGCTICRQQQRQQRRRPQLKRALPAAAATATAAETAGWRTGIAHRAAHGAAARHSMQQAEAYPLLDAAREEAALGPAVLVLDGAKVLWHLVRALRLRLEVCAARAHTRTRPWGTAKVSTSAALAIVTRLHDAPPRVWRWLRLDWKLSLALFLCFSPPWIRVLPLFCCDRGDGGLWAFAPCLLKSEPPFLSESGVEAVRAAGGMPRTGDQPRGIVSSGA